MPPATCLAVATWNVNSVKSRLPHLLSWLKRDAPQIVLLQELKCTEDAFPALEIEEAGYNLAVFGEKTYNGVAILSKFPLDDIRKSLPGDTADTQARYIEAVASLPGSAVRVASIYVPNGQDTASDKYAYKLRFLERLKRHAADLLRHEEMLVIGGDYNVAPYDADVHDPKTWAPSVLCHTDARARLRALLYMGLYDAYRLIHPAEVSGVGCQVSESGSVSPDNCYTWWDYRGNAFAADDGLRIDHLLLSPQAADRLTSCRIEKELRAQEKASDHAPVVCTFGEK